MLGMFGNRRSMNGQAMMGAMPDTLAGPQLQTMPMPQMPPMPQAPQDGRPTGARRIAGLLSSFASGALGQPDRYGDMIAQREQEQRQLQLRQQMQAEERAYEESRWRARQDYERANPEPDAFMRSMVAAGIDPNSDEGRRLIRQRVTNMADPLQFINNGNNTVTAIRGSQLGGQMAPAATPSGPAVGTISNGYRFKGGNPNDRNSWEPVGGQTQPASGNFRQ